MGLKGLSIAVLVGNFIAIAAFGRTPNDLQTMLFLAAVVGFFGNAAVSGLYSIAAIAFPTHVRATGTGFVIGVGRGGAVLSPLLVGYLKQGGQDLPSIGLIMGTGSLVAAMVLIFLKLGGTEQPVGMTNERTIPMAGMKSVEG